MHIEPDKGCFITDWGYGFNGMIWHLYTFT